jgi:hypothetical protein
LPGGKIWYHVGVRLIDHILVDAGDTSKCKKIRPFDLRFLGYEFTRYKIVLANTNYVVHEVIDAHTGYPASFCMLYCKSVMLGIILPFPYEKYALSAAYEKRDRKRIAKKRG